MRFISRAKMSWGALIAAAALASGFLVRPHGVVVEAACFAGSLMLGSLSIWLARLGPRPGMQLSWTWSLIAILFAVLIRMVIILLFA